MRRDVESMVASDRAGNLSRPSVRPRRFRLPAYPLVAALLGVVLGLGLVEVGLRVITPRSSAFYLWPPNFRLSMQPDPDVLPGVQGESRFIVNSQGIRGPEMGPRRQDEYRILAIGGSTTESFYLDQSEAWPHLLGETLGSTADGRSVWVGNIGRSGHVTQQHILAMLYALPQYDVDALVFLIGANDLYGRLYQDTDYDPYFFDKEANRLALFPRTFSVILPQDDPAWEWYRRTRMWDLARTAKRTLLAKKAARGFGFTQDETGKIFRHLREHRRSGSIVEGLPDLASALDEYERNITRLVEIGRKRGLRMVFLTQPTLYRAGLTTAETDLLWAGGIGNFVMEPGHAYYSAEAMAAGMDAYNRRLLEVCGRLALECMDLARAVPKNADMFLDDAHFTEAGARRVAEVVAGYFRERPPFTTVAADGRARQRGAGRERLQALGPGREAAGPGAGNPEASDE